MNQQSDGQRWMDGQTGKKWLKESKKKSMNDLKSFKNIKNVLKFVEIPFKQVCDGQTGGPTDQLTSQKVAYRGLGMA